ncbi:hypothetical protein ACN38_g3899 [Penicillium nordicum]|uniref:Elongin-A n=1 Tax=Penicillium nordicum TaxID=229535 RepID=A0A0M8P7J4_9EURO|nr:hypothetical protein ACN38_g3899 [Penicillium nordicum]
MPAPSLLHLATATAIRFVKDLDDLGAMPYSLARPILLNIHNPEKLHAMELTSPHLALKDEELWLELIKRDIPEWEKYQLPEHTNNWYGVYCDLRDQVQRALDADAEKLKTAIDGISAKRALLTPKLIPESKGLRMAGSRSSVRQRHTTYDRRTGMVEKKPSIFQPQKRNTALTMPTKSLNNRASQVKRAPISLVEEHRRPTEQSAPQPASKAQPLPPRISRRPGMHPPSLHNPMLAKNEARLRALTSSATPPHSGSSSDAPSVKKSPAIASDPKVKRRATSPPGNGEKPSSSSSSSLPGPPTSSLPPSRPPSSGPAPPRPGVIRRRPAPSIFMPVKRRQLS